MKALCIRAGLLAASVASVALPSTAGAAYYVPPSNSAATQYTEAFPTAGGDQSAEGGAGRHHSPAKVLGGRNAQRLESQGAEGHAVAEIAAETAPAESVVTTEAAEGTGSGTHHGTNGQPGEPSAPHRGSHEASQPRQRTSPSLSSVEPSGSSGLGEVIAQATGSSSSGGLGLLLPLVLLGTVVWSVAYLSSKRRKKPAA